MSLRLEVIVCSIVTVSGAIERSESPYSYHQGLTNDHHI